MLTLILAFLAFARASDNGYYYMCDPDESGYCYYVFADPQNNDYPVPTEWGSTPVEHVITRDTAFGMRKIVDISGTDLGTSPKPWVNGDDMVESTSMVEGDNWNFGLVFELLAPLRNMLMQHPDELSDLDTWNFYTRALTDCGIKTNPDAINEHGMGESSTDETYTWLTGSPTSHHTGLQYLEEGVIDLVCLVVDGLTTFERCGVIRDLYDVEVGVDRCDCWMPAYVAMYGEDPQTDPNHPFTTCEGIVPGVPTTADSAGTGGEGGNTGGDTGGDTGGTTTGPHCCDGSDPVTSGGPPTCADGTTALPPDTECETDEPTPTPTPEPTTTTTTEEPTEADGPFCCDGSVPNFNTNPPSCMDGSRPQPPTGSCDDEHTMQSKCTGDSVDITPFHYDGLSVYACHGDSDDLCSTDTAPCAADQLEVMDKDDCDGLPGWFEGECDLETEKCTGCGVDAGTLDGQLCCEWTTSTTEGPEPTDEPEGNYYQTEDYCPEGEEVMDSMDCEYAAEELDIVFVSKYEAKDSRAGCFEMTEGFVTGVYFNGHPEAPMSDENAGYVSICRRAITTTTERPTETTKIRTTTEEPECDEVCDLTRRVEVLESEVEYLNNDVPAVLANQFSAMADLEKLVEDLTAEVERLSRMVDDHSSKFSCLADMED